MQNVVELSFKLNMLGYVVVMKSELSQVHQVIDVLHVSRNQVVHGLYAKPFLDESITEM
jgi:hypothetical protein